MNKNKKLGITFLLIVCGMFSLSFAAVPLYSLFCKVTGYGGTPNVVASEAGIKPGSKNYQVRFNADVNGKLPWNFIPVSDTVKTKSGIDQLIFYKVKNTSNKKITGTATFNVTPLKAGKYFSKIQCFCFEKQVLQPGEEAMLPVSFHIDAEIEKDIYMDDVKTFTLSYTFFEAKE